MLTSIWIWVCFMQLEGNPLHKVTYIISPSNGRAIVRGRSASEGYSPTVCMFCRSLAPGFRRNRQGSIPVDNGSIDDGALESKVHELDPTTRENHLLEGARHVLPWCGMVGKIDVRLERAVFPSTTESSFPPLFSPKTRFTMVYNRK